MGKIGMLPSCFGTLHSKYKTPYVATVFVGIITMLTPFLGKNSLGWFVEASGFGTVIAYFFVALSFIVLRIKHPEYKRPFKVKHGLLVGIIAIIVSLFFIVLYLPVGSSSLNDIEWGIVIVWLAVGLIFYAMSLRVKDAKR